MKITVRKNKRKGSASITFRAGNDSEGAALAKAVMSADLKSLDKGLPVRIIEGLAENGVDRADVDLKIVEPKRRAKA